MVGNPERRKTGGGRVLIRRKVDGRSLAAKGKKRDRGGLVKKLD